MTLQERISVLDQLGKRLLKGDEYLDAVIHRTFHNNKWFTKENQHRAIRNIGENYLEKEKLTSWANQYEISNISTGKTVALIQSDNIPLFGFHDIAATFIAGHKSLIRLAPNDQYLLPCLLKFLKEIDTRTEEFFQISERLENFDAVITNSGNKSSKHLNQYFGKYPNIIREKRSSVAVLSGDESDADLLKLGDDIFNFYGLGPRNVSKIYFPKGYEIKPLLEILHEFKELVLNNKYKSNFDYNFAMHSLNRTPFHINGCVILVEEEAIRSRTSAVHYEFYENKKELEAAIEAGQNEIHHVVASDGFLNLKPIPFGKTQRTELDDYEDGKNTLEFLVSI